MEQMIMQYEVFRTADGSDSVKLKGADIAFHSKNGAIQESQHVFVENGLYYYLETTGERKKNISVFEVGFGTGLNALLTAKAAARRGKNIIYKAIDNYPLPAEIYSRLNYPDVLNEPELYKIIMQTGWNQLVYAGSFLKLEKIKADWLSYTFDESFDVIYFDAFAPDDQAEMWSGRIYEKMYRALVQGGVLVTYCSKSIVRKGLQAAGFWVEKLEGPPGKREIIRAVKR